MVLAVTFRSLIHFNSCTWCELGVWLDSLAWYKSISNSIPLTCLCILMPVPHCLDYYRFIVGFGSDGKASDYNAGDLVSTPGLGRSSGEGNGMYSSTLAWKIPWTEEHGRLQSMGLQRVRHDWATLLTYATRRYVSVLLDFTSYESLSHRELSYRQPTIEISLSW